MPAPSAPSPGRKGDDEMKRFLRAVDRFTDWLIEPGKRVEWCVLGFCVFGAVFIIAQIIRVLIR